MRLMTHALLLCAVSAAAASSWEEVEEIKDALRFSQLVRADDAATLAIFYDAASLTADRKSTLEEATRLLRGFARVVAVDVGQRGMSWVGDAYSIRTLPEVVFFSPDPTTISAGEGIARPGGYKQPRVYEKPTYTAEALKAWVVGKLPEPAGLHRLSAETKADLEKVSKVLNGRAGAVLFTEKDKLSPLFKSLAVTFKGRREFAVVKARKGAEALGLASLPALAKYDESGKQEVFDGSMDLDKLAAFLADGVSTQEERATEMERAEAAEFVMMRRRAKEVVIEIRTAGEWKDDVLANAHLTLVAFLDSSSDDHAGYIKSLAEFSKQATKKRSPVRSVVWIEAGRQQDLLKRFSLEPGGVIFISPKHSRWTSFRGALTPDGLARFVDGPLTRGTGAKQLNPNALPAFVDAE